MPQGCRGQEFEREPLGRAEYLEKLGIKGEA